MNNLIQHGGKNAQNSLKSKPKECNWDLKCESMFNMKNNSHNIWIAHITKKIVQVYVVWYKAVVKRIDTSEYPYSNSTLTKKYTYIYIYILTYFL